MAGYQATSAFSQTRYAFSRKLVYQQWSYQVYMTPKAHGQKWETNASNAMMMTDHCPHSVPRNLLQSFLCLYLIYETNSEFAEIAYRYTCGWESDTGTGFTQFTRTRNLRTYFCINYPSAALDRFKEDTKRTPSLVYRDFFLDALCEDDCLKGWQHSISERRELLLDHV